MARKDQQTIRLSAELWAQLDDLKGYFGEDRPAVLTYILRNWFSTSQAQINEQKAAIDRIKESTR
jgi:hypothetical protein